VWLYYYIQCGYITIYSVDILLYAVWLYYYIQCGYITIYSMVILLYTVWLYYYNIQFGYILLQIWYLQH